LKGRKPAAKLPRKSTKKFHFEHDTEKGTGFRKRSCSNKKWAKRRASVLAHSFRFGVVLQRADRLGAAGARRPILLRAPTLETTLKSLHFLA
jgi:hypothetical protein